MSLIARRKLDCDVQRLTSHKIQHVQPNTPPTPPIPRPPKSQREFIKQMLVSQLLSSAIFDSWVIVARKVGERIESTVT